MSQPAPEPKGNAARDPVDRLANADAFSAALYEVLQQVSPGIGELELYEFRYALHNLTPHDGWASVALDDPGDDRSSG